MESVKQAVGLSGNNNGAPRIAWIGLGHMGPGMLKNLVEKGSFTSALAINNPTTARLNTAIRQDKSRHFH